ncbi:MAG TPA: hypothetical protein VFN88_00240, partial [Caulobacteraceae bacterium]|nr:hypothetical protein [Caulobacteraceae bacterium]
QVSSVSGAVAITQGGQTSALTSSTVLRPGDRVIAMDGGQAQVKFADGCVMHVQAKSMATVGATSPCAASGLVKGAHPMDFAEGDSWAVPLAIIGFVGAFAAVVASEKSDDKAPVPVPISP